MATYYYNADLNICAEEQIVAEMIAEEIASSSYYNDEHLPQDDDYDWIIDELQSRREFYGWFECEFRS